jgi:hypothetical protein
MSISQTQGFTHERRNLTIARRCILRSRSFTLIETQQSNRMYVKGLSFVFLIVCILSKSPHASYIFCFATLLLLSLEIECKNKLNRLGWLYDWTIVNRQTGDTSYRYSFDTERFRAYDRDLYSYLDFDSVPFFVLQILNFYILS